MPVEEYYNITLNVDAKQAIQNAMLLSSVLYGILGLARRMGLPEEYDKMIAKIQQLIAVLNMLRVSMIAVQAVTGGVGGTMLGKTLVGVGIVGTIATFGDVMG